MLLSQEECNDTISCHSGEVRNLEVSLWPDYSHPASTEMTSVEAGQATWGAWVVQHIPAECLNTNFTRGDAVDPWGRETPFMNCRSKKTSYNK